MDFYKKKKCKQARLTPNCLQCMRSTLCGHLKTCLQWHCYILWWIAAHGLSKIDSVGVGKEWGEIYFNGQHRQVYTVDYFLQLIWILLRLTNISTLYDPQPTVALSGQTHFSG